MAAVAALAEVHQALQCIGFSNQAHRDSICEEAGFESLENFVGLSEKTSERLQTGTRSVPRHKVIYLLGCDASSSLLE